MKLIPLDNSATVTIWKAQDSKVHYSEQCSDEKDKVRATTQNSSLLAMGKQKGSTRGRQEDMGCNRKVLVDGRETVLQHINQLMRD